MENEKLEQFKEVTREMAQLYEGKNNAYGDSFGNTYKELGIISAVTRITDKCNRLKRLAVNSSIDNLGESMLDTLIDLANYSVMTIVEIKNTK